MLIIVSLAGINIIYYTSLLRKYSYRSLTGTILTRTTLTGTTLTDTTLTGTTPTSTTLTGKTLTGTTLTGTTLTGKTLTGTKCLIWGRRQLIRFFRSRQKRRSKL